MFKARKRGNMLYAGPEFAGTQPRYLPLLESLAGRLAPGQVHRVEVLHDADCDFFEGGCCDCSPTVMTATA